MNRLEMYVVRYRSKYLKASVPRYFIQLLARNNYWMKSKDRFVVICYHGDFSYIMVVTRKPTRKSVARGERKQVQVDLFRFSRGQHHSCNCTVRRLTQVPIWPRVPYNLYFGWLLWLRSWHTRTYNRKMVMIRWVSPNYSRSLLLSQSSRSPYYIGRP